MKYIHILPPKKVVFADDETHIINWSPGFVCPAPRPADAVEGNHSLRSFHVLFVYINSSPVFRDIDRFKRNVHVVACLLSFNLQIHCCERLHFKRMFEDFRNRASPPVPCNMQLAT